MSQAAAPLVASGKEVLGLVGVLVGPLQRIPADTQGLGGTAPSPGVSPARGSPGKRIPVPWSGCSLSQQDSTDCFLKYGRYWGTKTEDTVELISIVSLATKIPWQEPRMIRVLKITRLDQDCIWNQQEKNIESTASKRHCKRCKFVCVILM